MVRVVHHNSTVDEPVHGTVEYYEGVRGAERLVRAVYGSSTTDTTRVAWEWSGASGECVPMMTGEHAPSDHRSSRGLSRSPASTSHAARSDSL
jgi:hypothetical protein